MHAASGAGHGFPVRMRLDGLGANNSRGFGLPKVVLVAFPEPKVVWVMCMRLRTWGVSMHFSLSLRDQNH